MYFLQAHDCSTVWMLHNHKPNIKINRLHERCLRVTYEDHKTSFEELWEIDNSVSVHFENLQCLAIELYDVLNGNLSGYNDKCISIKQIFQL